MVSKQEAFFFEVHQDNPREGPGNFESTKKAFSMHGGMITIIPLKRKLRI